jgi:transcriptional regulator with XRE-family HTH domain
MLTPFGRWLQREIDARDWNLSGLAHRMGLAHSSVHAWMRGKTRPSPVSIRKLARVLEVPLTDVHIALGDIPPLDDLTDQQRRVVGLLLETDDPQLYRAVEALLLSLRETGE